MVSQRSDTGESGVVISGSLHAETIKPNTHNRLPNNKPFLSVKKIFKAINNTFIFAFAIYKKKSKETV